MPLSENTESLARQFATMPHPSVNIDRLQAARDAEKVQRDVQVARDFETAARLARALAGVD
jgi:hypothetical protein